MRIARSLRPRQTDPSPAATVGGGPAGVDPEPGDSTTGPLFPSTSTTSSRASSSTSTPNTPGIINNAAGSTTTIPVGSTPTEATPASFSLTPTTTVRSPFLASTDSAYVYPSSAVAGAGAASSQSGTRRNVVLIAVVAVLAPLCVIGVLLAFLTRRRRRRKIGRLMHSKESRAPSPDDDIFPVHFKSETADTAAMSPQRAEKLAIRTHDLESTDGLLTGGDRSSADLTPTQTQPTSVPSAASSQVERQFQASLEARARKMGIQPHQLLMLLTTSLDQQTGMSDVASSSDASSDRAFSVVSSSDRTFSLASVPPPAYDHPPRVHLHDLK
ncbi:hypothetical protein AURDEDRAFT_115012 [Auricularia subglabra TFB-10046 SS5]|nr:hypothetical protein AURDEDRAFT_115012 [Auricularia subglabra TFB-10046 SS5]